MASAVMVGRMMLCWAYVGGFTYFNHNHAPNIIIHDLSLPKFYITKQRKGSKISHQMVYEGKKPAICWSFSLEAVHSL
jgi:hypothetical protein